MKRFSKGKRHYLLHGGPKLFHGRAEPSSLGYRDPMRGTFTGGCWALQDSPVGDPPTVHFFSTAEDRIKFLRGNPRRYRVGKRNPLVKAFRARTLKLAEERSHGFPPGYVTVLYGPQAGLDRA